MIPNVTQSNQLAEQTPQDANALHRKSPTAASLKGRQITSHSEQAVHLLAQQDMMKGMLGQASKHGQLPIPAAGRRPRSPARRKWNVMLNSRARPA